MTKKNMIEGIVIISVLAWIPLSIITFYVSDVRLDIKLLIAAGFSFLGLLIF